MSLTFSSVVTAGPCRSTADIVFILDASGSIGQSNWDIFIQFLVDVIRGFEIGADQNRIGVVKFDRTAVVEIDLNDFLDMDSLADAIQEIVYTGLETNIADGLRKTRALFNDQARPGVPRVAVLFTDGEATEEPEETVPEADRLKGEGVRLTTIGITEDVNANQLRGIASNANSTILAAGFMELRDLLTNVQRVTCPPPPPRKCPSNLLFSSRPLSGALLTCCMAFQTLAGGDN